jgi:hypothetical protein
MSSMETALLALHAIRDAEERGISDLVEALWTTFFVAYARPFTANREIGGVSPKLVPPEHRDTHGMCMAARNALFGHFDPTLKSATDAGVLEVRIEVSRLGFVPIVKTPMPAPEEWSWCHDLTEAVLHQLHHQVGIDLQRIPGLRSLPDGLYQVDVAGTRGASLTQMTEDSDEDAITIDF